MTFWEESLQHETILLLVYPNLAILLGHELQKTKSHNATMCTNLKLSRYIFVWMTHENFWDTWQQQQLRMSHSISSHDNSFRVTLCAFSQHTVIVVAQKTRWLILAFVVPVGVQLNNYIIRKSSLSKMHACGEEKVMMGEEFGVIIRVMIFQKLKIGTKSSCGMQRAHSRPSFICQQQREEGGI